jgi:hypothetical protein
MHEKNIGNPRFFIQMEKKTRIHLKPILIVQSSPERTCSTLLVNIIYGLVYELSNQPVLYISSTKDVCNFVNRVYVIKTHILDLDYFLDNYENRYDIYFICSERKENGILIDEKYRSYPNVLIFDYQELLESPTNSVERIVDTVYKRMIKMIPKEEVMYSTLTAKKRIYEMNAYYETIKNRSFHYVNPFYEIHGSHRLRDGSGNTSGFWSLPINNS